MALTDRQIRAYKDIADIYNPIDIGTNRLLDGDIESLSYPDTPDYADIYGHREVEPEIKKGHGAVGLVNREDTPSLLDRWHCEYGLDIQTNALIYIKTINGATFNQWFRVTGDPSGKNWRANKQTMYIKRTTKGVGIP